MHEMSKPVFRKKSGIFSYMSSAENFPRVLRVNDISQIASSVILPYYHDVVVCSNSKSLFKQKFQNCSVVTHT